MHFMEVVANRFSCKKYDGSRPVEPEKLRAVLEAGRLAPTAKNLQEQHVYVVQSPEELAKIDSVTPCRYGAPTCLVVTYDKNHVFTYPGGQRDSGVEDAAIVATHMLLASANAGLDSCWVNFFDPEKVKEALALKHIQSNQSSTRQPMKSIFYSFEREVFFQREEAVFHYRRSPVKASEIITVYNEPIKQNFFKPREFVDAIACADAFPNNSVRHISALRTAVRRRFRQAV